jgi:glycosyltransferase involved in cell wall biosynthesis
MPLLTLNVGARNDSYMGDFKWRFSTMLNFLGKSVAAIGRQADIEVRVIDWNSEVPLHRVLTLCPEAAAITRFIVVPPEIAVPSQGDADFPIPIVVNVGIRHARGEFIAGTDSDVLFTPAMLLSLFAVLDGRVPDIPLKQSLMVAMRRHLPHVHLVHQPPLREIHEYIDRNHMLLPYEPPYIGTGVPAALVVMHRDRWSECRGYDEKFIHWGWMDVDLVLRMAQRYPLIYLNNFGVTPVHMEHYVKREYDKMKEFRKFNSPNDTPQFLANDENWGLAQYTFACERAEKVSDVDGDRLHPWVLTAAEAKQGMEDPKVGATIADVIGKLPFPVDRFELNALQMVGWYASTRHPRVYVETEMRQAHAACVVAKLANGTEIHATVSWDRLPEEASFYKQEDASATFFAARSLRTVGGQWAHSRFVGGDPATAVERLSRSQFGHFGVDLALVRSGPYGPQNAIRLAEHLNPGGAMVLTSPEKAGFETMWTALHDRFSPKYLFVQVGGTNAGMMMDATLKQ